MLVKSVWFKPMSGKLRLSLSDLSAFPRREKR